MKRYEKIIDGKKYIKPANRIILFKDNKQIFNPKEEMLLEDGWIEHIPVVYEPTKEDIFNIEKDCILNSIYKYDNSKEVNNCYINYQDQQISYWADKQERSVLKTAIQDCIAIGREKYRLDLRNLGISIEISCELLLQMLAALEVYAIDCYNVTTDHIYAVKKINTSEELKQYDYKAGYPEKLVFNI